MTRNLNLPAGVHAGISDEDYHGDLLTDRPTLSSTLARELLSRSPRHVWTHHPRLNPDFQEEPKAVLDIGRAAHRATLGAGGDYVVYPAALLSSNGAVGTKAAKEWEAEQRDAGRTPIKQETLDRILAMRRVLGGALQEIGLRLDPAVSELTALAEVEGVLCRARIDNAPVVSFKGRRILVDFKTCEDASADACIRACENYAYDSQAAHYLDTWKAATGEERTFLHIFQEKSAPWEVGFVRLHDAPGDEGDWLQSAREKMAYARRQWAHCLLTDTWPGYPRQVAVIGARKFYLDRWANQGTNDWQDQAAPKPSQDAINAARRAQAPEGVS